MTESGKKRQSLSAKILTMSALGILLSFGLCGLGQAVENSSHGDWVLVAGFYVLGASVVGIAVGVVAAIVEGFNSPRRSS